MEHLYSIVVIAQTMAIYLGVGCSTLAISSFFTAIYDGVIEPVERRMLGVIYWVLRFAMVLIVVSTAILHIGFTYPQDLLWYMWILIAVLFLNAILMTVRVMPSKFGPSIQAATWYTLGFLVTIEMFNLYELTDALFWSLYVGDLLIMLLSVNSAMVIFKIIGAKKRVQSQPAVDKSS